MNNCTFIHAADLHLDAPFQGLRPLNNCQHSAAILPVIQESTFTALERLITLCLAEHVDFLILSGDIYNSKASSLKARLTLRKHFEKLSSAGVKVFIAHGNHDPLEESSQSITWPNNVFVFGGTPSSVEVKRNGETIALVQGISHTRSMETENLASLFTEKVLSLDNKTLPHIGVLHCALTGSSAGHAPYAPCTPQDFIQKGLDYWALGHVHTPQCHSINKDQQAPFYAYPGSLQGLHVNEDGPRGCWLVKNLSPQYIALSPVLWHHIYIDIENIGADATIAELEEYILEAIHKHIDKTHSTWAKTDIYTFPKKHNASLHGTFAKYSTEQAENEFRESKTDIRSWNTPQVHAFRLHLEGRTHLHKELALEKSLEDLQNHINYNLMGSIIWVRDIVNNSKPQVNTQEMLKRQDLPGEMLRISQYLSQNPEELKTQTELCFSDLNKLTKARKFLAEQQEQPLDKILAKAENICIDLVEEK